MQPVNFEQLSKFEVRPDAANLRKQAQGMPSGVRRDELLRKARRADPASHLDEWANSPGLQPPK
jgi:hypothetical protein